MVLHLLQTLFFNFETLCLILPKGELDYFLIVILAVALTSFCLICNCSYTVIYCVTFFSQQQIHEKMICFHSLFLHFSFYSFTHSVIHLFPAILCI